MSSDPDTERLAALRRSGLLDTPAEPAFDRLAGLAAKVLRAPVALVSLVDADRQFFKSCVGLAEPWATARETPLTHSFCRHVVASSEPLVVEDARLHPPVRDNPAIADLGVAAYLGVPLRAPSGHVLGALCVIDDRPRTWSADDLATLGDLAASVMTEVALRAEAAERMRAERERRESEERYRTLFASIGEGFCTIEVIFDDRGHPVDYRVLEINPAFEDHTGLRDAVGRTMREVIPGHEEHGFEAYGRVATTGEPARFVSHAAGLGDRWFEVYACRIGGPGSREVAVLFNDITQRRAAEAESRKLAAIVESSEDAIISKDLSGTITSWNAAAERIFGYTAAEMIGRPITDLIPEDLIDEEVAIMAKLRRGERVEHFETRRRAKDGRILDLALTISPIRVAGGEIIGASKLARDITERKRADAELRRSRDRLALALEASEFVGTWDWDFGADLMTADERFAHLYSVDPESAARGAPLREYTRAIHPDDRACVLDAIEGAVRLGAPYQQEYRLVDPDGSVRWVVARGRVQPESEGRRARFPGVAIDITRRKAAEESVARSEQRFRALVTATSDAVYRMSPDWSEMRQLHGRGFIADTPEPSRTWLETYIPPEDRPHILEAIAEAVRAKGVFEREHRVLRADGTPGWAFSRAVPILDDRGEVVEWFGTASDVTPRKEAEAEKEQIRQESERQRRIYEAALSNTPDFAYVWNLDHRFLYANEALLRMWGRTREDAIGKHCLELGYEPWHAEMHDREIDQVVATKQPLRGEVPFTGTDGRRIYDYILVPVVGPSGEVEAVAGTTRDVTARKAVEEAAEAERANRTKDEFLATLSHELRTPLNAIIGWAKILRTGQVDEEDLQEGLEAIDRNGLAQSRLIEDLLDVSRITTGKLRLDVQRLNIADVIEAALAAVAPAAAAKQIRILKTLDSLVGPVTGDSARLQQVVWNLVSNAVKFTPKGGKVQLLLERVDSHIEISVIDTGMGISPEFLPHVFDRFRQADSSTTRRHGGLGLGPSIVQHLVEMHGGSIRAKSPGEGQGATFTVMLPITVVHPERPEIPEARPKEDPAGDGLLRDGALAGLKVLVVDDEADARRMIRRALLDRRAEVATAASAEDALGRLADFGPDVIISDIGMPGRDGYDLISRVRETSSAKEVPAIALTAFARTEDRKRAMLAGFQAHVAKPVDPAELTAVVASLAGRTGRRDGPHGGPP